MNKKIISLLLSIFIILPISTFSVLANNIEDTSWDNIINKKEDNEFKENYNNINNKFKLNKFESNQDFNSFLEKNFLDDILNNCNYRQPIHILYRGEMLDTMVMNESVNFDNVDTIKSINTTQNLKVKSKGIESNFSQTNVQKKSVDEPEILKNTKGYIFYFNKKEKKILIFKSPINDLNKIDINNVKIIKEIKVPNLIKNDIKMFATDNRLVILGTRFRENSYIEGVRTDILIYDISNLPNLKIVNLFETKGNFSKSRLIDNKLYVISNYNINGFKNEICNKYVRNPLKPQIKKIEEDKKIDSQEKIDLINELFKNIKTDELKQDISTELKKGILQRSIDIAYNPNAKTKIGNTYIPYDVKVSYPGYKSFFYIPNDFDTKIAYNNNFNIITSLDIDNVNIKNMTQNVLWGNIQNGEIHMTKDNLYLVNRKYNNNYFLNGISKMIGGSRNNLNTLIHKLHINGLNLNYVDSTIISGEPLNQYSMDESDDGNFRIFLTQDYGKRDVNLFIFDKNLKLVSRLKNIEKNEQFKSARFIGNKAYLVTFKATDPLFVIDMKNIKEPRIVGELKIPGYSLYLHPYGQEKNGIQYLIGIGQEAEEVHGNWSLPKNIKVDLYKIDYNQTIGQYCLKFSGEDRNKCLKEANIKIPALEDYNCKCPEGAQCLIACKDPIEKQKENILNSKNAKNIYVKQEHSIILGKETTVGGNTSYTPVFEDPRTFVFSNNTKELVLPVYLTQNTTISNEDGFDNVSRPYYNNQKNVYFAGIKILKLNKDGINEIKSVNYLDKIKQDLKEKNNNSNSYNYSFNNKYSFKNLDNRVGIYGNTYFYINNLFLDLFNNNMQHKMIKF